MKLLRKLCYSLFWIFFIKLYPRDLCSFLCVNYISPPPLPPDIQKESNFKNQYGLLILSPLSRIIDHDSPTPSLRTTATFPGALPYFFHPALLLLGPLQWHLMCEQASQEKTSPPTPPCPAFLWTCYIRNVSRTCAL